MFLVTGATGSLGRRIVRVLRDRDRPTKAFVRLNSRYGELEQRGAQLVIGDLRRDRDIAKACEGVRYIISTHGSERDPAQIQYRANIELIDRAVAEGVEHFVYLSVLGCDRGYEDSLVFKAKREVERYLQASGLNYTILRPSGFASNLLPLAENFRQTGVYLLIGDPQNRTSIVSTDDLARIAVDSVEIEAARNQVFAVGGPDILQREDIPRIFGRLFNREPLILNPPLLAFDGVRNALGVVNPQLQKSLGTLRVLLANEYFCTPAEVERLESVYSMKMESLEGFLRRYLAV
ncbi:SDR family oxidoreductase [Desertifilum sp. FACHB-1129]|uniref:Oxidoreductase n=1 Tax=Desertifilum tharense IPPAS B-1220 TaxID=1781255 RepID=A0A1E5QR75_9CYAN|nr:MULTISPECIES: SDR family oxidoreductase [Desertifilum]MDA0210741.1 SDR family oxidoreductase [Cyanobacteria bacterium FC1]MBD2312227.1 SDR family oxidoreductase [Desertifilum sp. FACHB-1129]MBD2323706.1 SDR family oxidoreductase [Desertifilum sp. FACHB-866]MBD2332403.1 SDR family oxidoreductase [Desertifilum sp. FACHB-868]OEJ77087.1 oxidoreductase [Desertifilum tharense IPPAS B-1220]